MFTEPCFCLRLLISANAPYVYRLEGPGSWDKAKETLITLPERVKVPLKNRECRMKRYKRRGKIVSLTEEIVNLTVENNDVLMNPDQRISMR